MKQGSKININGVDIIWDTKKGMFTFFDKPAALFWLNPSLLTMLQPLADEIGYKLFKLKLASSASYGTHEDYYNMVSVLSDNFESGFIKWGKAVASAGWGTFEILNFDQEQKCATVRVTNTWELVMQKDMDDRWGCPFIQGKIIGIFSHAFATTCWADEERICYYDNNPFIEFKIYESNKTIANEIEKERLNRMQEKEQMLANKVAQSTKDLNQAKVIAETASLAKSRFLSSMSHELKTPLNSIIGFSELLTYAPSQDSLEQHQDSIRDIIDAGKSMLMLIEQLLTFSTITDDNGDTDIDSFKPLEIINSLFPVLKPIASKHNITFSNAMTLQSNFQVMGNHTYFKEIILSFITNAIKYIAKGGHIELLNQKTNNNSIQFVIKDNGPGIPIQKQANLFTPFDRLDQQTGVISGAGVGLSIAKLMANKMNGEIGFENNKTSGASFWLELPTTNAPLKK